MKGQHTSKVSEKFGKFAPAYTDYSEEVLFGNLWKRPNLTPKERSLVTLASLVSAGNFQQIPFHLQLALDNGLTQAEAVEAITHVCFYAGWPRADSALSIAKDFFQAKQES